MPKEYFGTHRLILKGGVCCILPSYILFRMFENQKHHGVNEDLRSNFNLNSVWSWFLEEGQRTLQRGSTTRSTPSLLRVRLVSPSPCQSQLKGQPWRMVFLSCVNIHHICHFFSTWHIFGYNFSPHKKRVNCDKTDFTVKQHKPLINWFGNKTG